MRGTNWCSWLYDTVNDQPFRARTQWLKDNITPNDTLVLVETHDVKTAADVEAFKIQMLERGFEGSMLRNADSLYVNKRSYDLQKCKDMVDGEFPIVDFEEGSGRLSGHVGSFWCVVTKEYEVQGGVVGERFTAKPKGKTSKLKEYFKDHSLWRGKKLTVQYQNFTPAGKPRFPVGKGIRDYE